MITFHSSRLLFLFISPAMNQFTTTSGTPIPTSAPYAIPITGPSLNASIPWGVNVTRSSNGDGFAFLYRVSISDKRPSVVQAPIHRIIPTGNESGVQLLVTTDSSNYNLVLGPENNLTAHAPDADDDVDVPTVPFGINTGLRYAWNGSLTLNGYYDANRINSTSWIRLSDSDQSSPSKFLNDGLYRFRATVRSKEQEQGRDLEAVLSLNETSISLPPNFVCENVTIEPSQESTFPIRIPDYLLDSADRCVVRNESSPPDDVDTIVLGVPFWQAAYVYATRNEADGSSAEVYLAQANDYNLTSKPERFDAQQTLTPPSKPEGYKEPTSDGVVVRSSIACTLVILFTCALVFL